MSRDKLTATIGTVFFVAALGCFARAGYWQGKHNADRWYQAHRATVTRMDLKYRGHILRVCPDTVHCTDYTVLPRCSEWDSSCGFKPGDWNWVSHCYDANGKLDPECKPSSGSGDWVDSDNTICYDPTTGKRCDLPIESKQDVVKP